jgi:hypothetical protein
MANSYHRADTDDNTTRMPGHCRAFGKFFFPVLLALAGCASQDKFDVPAQYFVPSGSQIPVTISGHLDETVIDNTGDETVTIMIDDQIAAIGGFQSSKGVADASFIGAFRGAKVTVHCTNKSSGKGYVCDVQVGTQHAATLTF